MLGAFRDAELRINRARVHAKNFENILDAFVRDNPSTYWVDPHADGTQRLLKLRLPAHVPDDLAILAAEIAFHLRSALDSVGHRIVLGHGVVSNPQHCHFPFGGDIVDALYRNNDGRSKDLPVEIFDFMRRFQPYKGGNDLLWSLNQLANTTKHETLVAVPMQVNRTFAIQFDISGGEGAILPKPEWDRAKNEFILAVWDAGADVKYDFAAPFDVCFDNVGALFGQPALGILDKLIDGTTKAVILIGLEARRCKYIK